GGAKSAPARTPGIVPVAITTSAGGVDPYAPDDDELARQIEEAETRARHGGRGHGHGSRLEGEEERIKLGDEPERTAVTMTADELVFAIVGDTRPAQPDDTKGYPVDAIKQIWKSIEAANPKPRFAI